MKQQQRQSWSRGLTILFLGGSLLFSATSNAVGVGNVKWQNQYTPTSSYQQGYFNAVGFNADGSILAVGNRSEADSGTAIGIRYNTETGAVVDAVPEWFLFEFDYWDFTHDTFRDLHVDNNGNIYFVGTGYRATKNNGVFRYNVPNIWKYSSSYNNPNPGVPDRPLWRNYYVRSGTDAQENGYYQSMAVDSTDNIYAVGYYLNLASVTSNRDWIIDKFDSEGTRADGFPISHNGDNLNDYAYGVATDSEDNFVVVGSVLMDVVTDHYDWVVRKYQSDGSLLWETQNDLSSGHDQAFSVVVDGDDNIIVAGYRINALPEADSDWYIVKYAKNGDGNGGASIIWEKSWDDGNSKSGEARGMVLDERGFIYIVGNQRKDSADPFYSDRNRPVVQYRNGNNGDLLGIQDIVLDATPNNEPNEEHDYLVSLALEGDQLVIGGYTQQDGLWSLSRKKTGRVVMLELFGMFADGFE